MYYATDGRLLDHQPGTFIVAADSADEARKKLMHEGGLTYYTPLQRAWSPGLDSMVEDIENNREDYYTRVSKDIYFFET